MLRMASGLTVCVKLLLAGKNIIRRVERTTFPAEYIPEYEMTVKTKRIKTHYMSGGQKTVSAGTSVFYLADDYWHLQDDITVIGVFLGSQIYKDNEYDSGLLQNITQISRNAVMNADGEIACACAEQQGLSVTVGVGAETQLGGDPRNHVYLMFPEGYGIDIDDGEDLYLNTHMVNTMAQDQIMNSHCLIYYVER
jgi:hypothetical protein